MTQNNLLQELETLFNSFTGESLNDIKDYNSLHTKLENGLVSYLNFIKRNSKLREPATIILEDNIKSPKISNINDLYQSRILGDKKRLGSIDVFSKKIYGIAEFHKLLVIEVKKTILDTGEKYHLHLQENVFYYNQKPIKIIPSTLLYKILRGVYEYLDGKDGVIEYKDLLKLLNEIDGLKGRTTDQLKTKIRQELTSETMGLNKKISTSRRDGHKLFETEDGKRLIFNNKINKWVR